MCQMQNPPISVLIVEDHPMFRDAIAGYLATQPDRFQIVGVVGTPTECLQQVSEAPPDIVLLDLGLPERTDDGIEEGLETIQNIRGLSPSTQVVILTGHRRTDAIFRAIQAGATTYLLKSITASALIDSLLQVHAGEPPVDQEVARRLWEHLQNPIAPQQSFAEVLTPRETEIVRLIAENYNNQQIADHLVISPRTVKKHVSNIFSKLQLHNRYELRVFYRTRHLPVSSH